MKFGIAIIVALVVFCFSSSVYCGETDVIRVYHDNLGLTNEEIDRFLRQADLESHGFEKTVEIKYETDKNGKKTEKKTVYFKATDLCSKVGEWEAVLTRRLPEQLRPSKLASTILNEVEDRLAGRNTKSCTVILEVHYQCSPVENPLRGLSKRTVRGCGICLWFCSSVAITYV